MKKFLHFLAGGALLASLAAISFAAEGFNDLPSSHTHYDAILYVQGQGIVEGYENGNYGAEDPIKRSEFTKIIMESRYSDDEIFNCGAAQFDDVPNTHWSFNYMCLAVDEGIINGYDDGSFRPDAEINFAEAAKIISLGFGHDPEEDEEMWYRPYVVDLAAHFAVPTELESMDEVLTRGEMAELIYRMEVEPGKASHSFGSLQLLTDISYSEVTEVEFSENEETRNVESNGIAHHDTGAFPNSGNPNEITEQNHSFEMPLTGTYVGAATDVSLGKFGVAMNGVPFDPGAAEWWDNDQSSGWQYNPLSDGIDLGLDFNNAHVQPTGTYHYHGFPTGLMDYASTDEHSPLIGYAADGFPIYGLYSYTDANDRNSEIVVLESSWQLKDGTRDGGPGGAYDGTFNEDYEYIEGLGDLDECNGRFGVTPEYPDGTYYYLITEDFPVVPRCFMGEPDDSFGQAAGAGAGAGGVGPSGPPPHMHKD